LDGKVLIVERNVWGNHPGFTVKLKSTADFTIYPFCITIYLGIVASPRFIGDRISTAFVKGQCQPSPSRISAA